MPKRTHEKKSRKNFYPDTACRGWCGRIGCKEKKERYAVRFRRARGVGFQQDKEVNVVSYHDFDSLFQHLTGNLPFPWQRQLYREFLDNDFRQSCPIPTGLGKTSIIAIWLLALAHRIGNDTHSDFPRRLVYVVNRRTVVDQSTRETEKIREALRGLALQEIAESLRSVQVRDTGLPFAASTLRGQFADNAEWRDDPARPAVIIGTVDMIGSRLLFSGYGCGFKSRPLHAGFLGQNTLVIHDEAHLEPAFQILLKSIEKEQRRCREFGKFRIMELSATSRSAPENGESLFSDKDREHHEVRKRIEARKGIVFHQVDDERKMVNEVVKLAREYEGSGQAILIFLRKLENVKEVAAALGKNPGNEQVATLTGTLRGRERDALARDNPVFARFLRNPETNPQPTVYLVCTSAGEVGVNISADHLICDLTPLDSMIQRFGRANRFGDGDACIDIVHCKYGKAAESKKEEPTPPEDDAQTTADSNTPDVSTAAEETKKKGKASTPFDQACEQTFLLLQNLPKRWDQCHDASPSALAGIPAAERQVAFTPSPVILPATDILFDAWALTSIRRKLPGRPPVADWLHGVAEWEPPETHVAWREEVSLMTTEMLETYHPEDLLEDYPLKPHEMLRDQTTRVRTELEKIAGRAPEESVWLIAPDDAVTVFTLQTLVEKDKQKKPMISLAGCTMLLPPQAGGLNKGFFDGEKKYSEAERDNYDISDKWLDESGAARRCRIRGDDDQKPPIGMRLIRRIDLRMDSDEDAEEMNSFGHRSWYWYVRPRFADDDGSRTARVEQTLSSHLRAAGDFAKRLVAKLGLGETEALAVMLAARWHDCGKDRLIWQRSIGNHKYPARVLAKSGKGMRPLDLTGYRHELGSLTDVANFSEFKGLSHEAQELVLHLIGAHHGRARPHFSEHEAFDHKGREADVVETVRKVHRRFALLQRKYGRWGLAYLESLVRAADIMASQADNGDESGEPSNAPGQGGDQ